MGSLECDTGDSESSSSLLNRVFGAKHDHQGELLDIELDLSDAPNIIKEALRNSKREISGQWCLMEGRVRQEI